MSSGMMSEAKMQLLRQVTNCAIPDSHLRRALIKNGGNIDAAASALITDPSYSARTSIPVSKPSTAASPSSRPVAVRRAVPQRTTTAPATASASAAAARASSPMPPPSRSSTAPAAENAVTAVTTTHAAASVPDAAPSTPASTAPTPQALRRIAWRYFYAEQRDNAILHVGHDKRAIDVFIAESWRKMGNVARKQYVARIAAHINADNTDRVGNETSDAQPDNGVNVISATSARPDSPVPPSTTMRRRDVSPPRLESKSEPGELDGSASNVGPAIEKHDDSSVSLQKPDPPSNDQRTIVSLPTFSAHSGELIDVDTNCDANAKSIPSTRRNDDPSGTPQTRADSPINTNDAAQPEQITGLNGNHVELEAEVEWPRKLTSRLCRGSMLTRLKTPLGVGEQLVLETPPLSRGLAKSQRKTGKRGTAASEGAPACIVRFSKYGRELGRLASDIGHSLAPGLQSGYVSATCKVVSPPERVGMFAELFLEVSIFLNEAVFDESVDEEKVEGGYDSGDGEDGGQSTSQGVDVKRMHVIQMLSSLKLCEPPTNGDVGSGLDSLPVGEAGAVSEENAEAYYRTVTAIQEKDAIEFVQSKYLTCTLREYQRVGVKWMISREKYGNQARMFSSAESELAMNPLWKKRYFPDGGVFFMNSTTGGLSLKAPVGVVGGPYGGILADEMGLGKTVQCIACIVHDVEEQCDIEENAKEENPAKEENVEMKGAEGETGSENVVAEDDATLSRASDVVGDTEMVDGEGAMEQVDSLNGNIESSSDDDVEEPQVEHVKPVPSRRLRRSTRGHGRQAKRERAESVNESPADINHADCDNGKDEGVGDEDGDGDGDDDDDDNSNGDDKDDKDWDADESLIRKGSRRRLVVDDKEDEEEDEKEEEKEEEKEVEKEEYVDDEDDFVTRPVKRLRRSSSLNSKNPIVIGKKSAVSFLMSASKRNRSRKGGTLIVCPMSLVSQWMNELEVHVAPGVLRCVDHYGQTRGGSESISLNVADVVVTTYGVLSSEYVEEEKGKGNSTRCGPIFDIEWRRVILDEAHTIKSRVTRWAKAAYRVKAERRWCVTGTVIHNHVNDVFSLLHFVQLKPWSSWAFWNRGVVINLEGKDVAAQKAAMSLIRDIISSVTIRRKKSTKDSTGRPIVSLTKKTVDLVRLTPSAEEKDFYTALETRSKLKFDAFLAQGKVMNNYASVLELLLRLRQACNHPYLVFAAAPSKDSQVLKDKDKLYKLFMQGGSSSQSYVEKVLKDAESGSLEKTHVCPVCLEVIEDAVAPKECGHPACRSCLMSLLEQSHKCPICRGPIIAKDVLTLPRTSRFSVDLERKWKSSVKIDTLLEEVRERDKVRNKDRRPIGKSVIFSQFTSMLDLVEHALKAGKFRTLRIDGSVPQAQRADILERFDSEHELDDGCANILLVSLRAGGVGLNLVSASHAILLDIHWNPQVDAQAQDRIHRHGQTRDVTVRRYVVKDTVEERLLRVQERKQDLADGALGVASDEDKKQARLSELKLLFSG